MNSALTEIQRAADRHVTDHLDQFDPFEWHDPDKKKIRRKAFSELGLYLYATEQYGDGNPEIRNHVENLVNDPRFPKLLRRYPDRFGQIALPAIVMDSIGDLNPETANAVDDALRSPHLWGKEPRPYKFVVLLSQCLLWGYDEHDYDLDTVLQTSNVVHPPDVIAGGKDEFYGLTHNVMFSTALGTDHPDLLDAPLPYDLERSITGALLRFMAKGNADVVLELILIGTLQRQLPDRLLQYAVRWVAEEKTTDAYVVPPAESNDESEDSDTEDASMSRADVLNSLSKSASPNEKLTTRTWSKRYHTNLSAGLMVTVLEGTLDLSEYDSDDISLSSAEFEDLLALGRALNQLHDYDLGPAAETLSTIRETTLAEYPEISSRIVEFLERQRTGDSFGYWTDERRLYEQKTGDDSDFEEKLVGPLSEKCETALEHVNSSLSVTPPGQ